MSPIELSWTAKKGYLITIFVPAFLLIGTEILQQINGVPEVLLSEFVL